MALLIQRVARGLSNVLTTFGGQTPQQISEQVIGNIDLLQFYGATQLQVRTANDAALAEGGNITITVPANEHWILFGMSTLMLKTATQTALRGAMQIATTACISQSFEPFGATETGAVRLCWYAPYPRLLLPNTALNFNLEILGTDANANCSFNVQVGVLG